MQTAAPGMRALALVAGILASCAGPERAASGPDEPDVFAIRGARIFDGVEVLERGEVLVRGGVIAAVGEKVEIPAGARVVEAHGHTLVPGFIDAHTHAWADDHLAQALVFGVTTELDMLSPPAARHTRADPRRAELFSSGYAVTAAGGHGTAFGFEVPALEPGDEVAAFVAARVAEGSDYIKIIYDGGGAWGVEAPTLSRAQLGAAIRAAQEADRLAVVHIGTAEEARHAAEEGAHGLVHLPVGPPDPALATALAERDVFVIPALSVMFSICDGQRGYQLGSDPHIAPFLRPNAARALASTYRFFNPGILCNELLDSVTLLRERGVELLVGTDAANPGTAPGASLHDELALFVRAGLTPVEALAAATSRTADRFGLSDRGRIEPGLRADLVLIEGDPTRDITTTRRIASVWKAGDRLSREAFREAAAQSRGEERRLEIAPGAISSFSSPEAMLRTGHGPFPVTDAIRGGRSEVELARIEIDPGESAQALEIAGYLTGREAFAGAMIFLGEEPTTPADFSSIGELRVRVRGEGRELVAWVFAAGEDAPVAAASMPSGPAWAQLSLHLESVPLEQRRNITGLFFGAAGGDEGEFTFAIDDLRLHPATP
jgi:imidazolonepropionase-like amidohydrolase